MHAHPDDLGTILAFRSDNGPLSWRETGLLTAFIRVCDLLEPDLVWGAEDKMRRVEWLVTLSHVRSYLSFWDPQSDRRDETCPQRELDRLASFAGRAWRGPSKGPRRPLPFVLDPELRAVAERDLASLNAARKADEVKVALVLAGCVVEAVLADVIVRDPDGTDKALQNHQKLKNVKQLVSGDISKWQFYQMITVCGPGGLGVLSEKTEQIANTVRDWRNFVHPVKECAETKSSPLKPSDAAVAEALVEKILDEVQEFRRARPG